MKTRIPRKLTACFAALAIATSGLAIGGVAPAHAASASVSPPRGFTRLSTIRPDFFGVTYSLTVGPNYSKHGTNMQAVVNWRNGPGGGCLSSTCLVIYLNWGDGSPVQTWNCNFNCGTGQAIFHHAYGAAGTYGVSTYDNLSDGTVGVTISQS